MRLVKTFLSAILLITLLTALPSCQQKTTSNRKSVIVTYSVLGSIVKELVGDQATVTISVPNGLDPHEWEPSAKDIETINRADLIVQNGLGLEAGMEKTLKAAQDNGVKFFTASDHITVRHIGQGEGIPSQDPDQAIGAADPHLWMDPLTMKDVVTALTLTLQETIGLDVLARGNALENRLDSLNSEIMSITSVLPYSSRKLVTGHESMGYFAKRYDFQLIGVIIPSLSSQASVSAANLAALIKVIQENEVKAIFTELGTSIAVAKTIGQDTGVKVVELSTHLLPKDGSYFTFMRDIANTITYALK
jgi:zinc/manganese transport system substrate-binding protein